MSLLKPLTFMQAVTADDLAAQIRFARETARQIILRNGLQGDEDLLAFLDPLVGGRFDPKLTQDLHDVSGDLWADYSRHIDAAYAVGICVGQLVHPDVFKKDRRR